MTIFIIFFAGFLAGQLAQARRYSKMALSASAPIVELPELKIVTSAPAIVEASTVKPATPAQDAAEQTEPVKDKQAHTSEKEAAKARREAEKAAVAQQRREQAAIDYDHYAMQRDRLMELADVVENELTGNITEKRRAALMRQRITLEERLYQTEKRMNRAYFICHSYYKAA